MMCGRLLPTTRHCDVTDPRDRVYPLLSLSENETLAKPFPIDYTISAGEMYSRLTEWYFMTRGIGFMSFATITSRAATLQPPSWAPNRTEPETFRPLGDYTKQQPAGGKCPPTGCVGPEQVLNIDGKCVDSIDGVLEQPSSSLDLDADFLQVDL